MHFNITWGICLLSRSKINWRKTTRFKFVLGFPYSFPYTHCTTKTSFTAPFSNFNKQMRIIMQIHEFRLMVTQCFVRCIMWITCSLFCSNSLQVAVYQKKVPSTNPNSMLKFTNVMWDKNLQPISFEYVSTPSISSAFIHLLAKFLLEFSPTPNFYNTKWCIVPIATIAN